MVFLPLDGEFDIRRREFQRKFREKRIKYITFGLIAVLFFLTIVYLGPLDGLERFGLLIRKKISQLLFAAGIENIEAENASISGPVVIGNDSSASGGKYIEFGSTSITGTTYYVDCNLGNDNNDGKTETSAWKNISKVNSALGSSSLSGGDGVLLKRDCTWPAPLNIPWNGTASQNIIVGAYGSGTNLPTISRNSNGANVSISGSYVTIENIWAKADPPSLDSGCQNNPKGAVHDFSFESGSHDNTLRTSKATGAYAGVFVKSGSHHNHILNNQLVDNIMMSPLDSGGNNDAGAFAVLLHGDDNEVAYNTMTGSNACSYDYVTDGSAIEVYGGQRNNSHHNIAFDDDAFAELGNSRSADNTFAYNRFTSSSSRSLFLVTRGPNDAFGPIYRTTLYNNSVYLPSSFKGAIVCYAGCSTSVLKMRNNIIQGGVAAIDADGPVDEDYNLFAGTVKINGSSNVGPNSLKTDPQFVNPSVADLHLKSTSPAVNAGTIETVNAGFTSDLDGKVVPTGSAPDMGAYEF